MFRWNHEEITGSLNANRLHLVESWLSKAMIRSNDSHQTVVASSVLDLIIYTISNSGIREADLKMLAQQVAHELVHPNSNIAEFVHNVSIGRTVLFEYLYDDGLLSMGDPLWTKFNFCFDYLLMFASQRHNDLENEQRVIVSSLTGQDHRERLSVLGEMASSFVHEFRNPLTSIIGFVQLLEQSYPDLEYVGIVMHELNQLKFRINQFLLLSRGGVENKKKEEIQLGTIFDDTLDFLYPMIVNAQVSVERATDNSILFTGYTDDLRQVFINIIMNSLEALSECTPRILRVSGQSIDNRVVIDIANNGPQIPKGIESSIFDPFVSSKKSGTGIGLYVCKKIIDEHGGCLECASNEDWTTFRIIIPFCA